MSILNKVLTHLHCSLDKLKTLGVCDQLSRLSKLLKLFFLLFTVLTILCSTYNLICHVPGWNNDLIILLC